MDIKAFQFPKDFIWETATAFYQIEGEKVVFRADLFLVS